MQKLTEEIIGEVISDVAKEMTKRTSEILLENYENCLNIPNDIEDKEVGSYLSNVMVPLSTAYQLSMYTMYNVLCELLLESKNKE